MKEKKLYFFILIGFLYFSVGQAVPKLHYEDARHLAIVGKAFDDTPNPYHRIDTARYSDFSRSCKSLYRFSSGIAISFKTNSTIIAARWLSSKRLSSENMSAIGQKGLDLYIKKDGKWVFAGVGKPKIDKHESVIVDHMDNSEKECLLYLPLFDEVHKLEIGVDENAHIIGVPDVFRHRIVVYGSSITHGAAASRSGMSYCSLLSRRTGLDFLNLGVAGNAKFQMEHARMIVDAKPDVIILDCIPNPNPQEITERTASFMNYLREKCPDVPIIFIQSIVRELGNFDLPKRKYESDKRQAARTEVKKLLKNGYTKLYFIEEDHFLGDDHNGTMDGTHPTDLGFERMLGVIQPQIMKILKKNHIK